MTTASDLNNPFSRAELKRVKEIQFGVLSPQQLQAMSVCKVEHAEMYEKGLPKRGGLQDPRMGTIDFRVACETCGMSQYECPGHFGHLELAKPMYLPGYIKTVLKVLRCVCYSCSRILVNHGDAKVKRILKGRLAGPKFNKERLAYVMKLANSVKKCDFQEDTTEENQASGLQSGGCGSRQPKYSRTGVQIVLEWKKDDKDMEDEPDPGDDEERDSKRNLTAEEAHAILKRISPEDMETLGFDPVRSQPAWMICSILPIPPPAVRPSVLFGGSDRSEDDLTNKLNDIVKINAVVKKQENSGAPVHIVNEYAKTLQWHIITLIDNGIPGLPVAATRSKKPIKAIRARLKGKEGRLRGNLMGKRCDFSARTVITGDPNLAIDQVGVPRSIAMNLTFPETVTAHNIHELKRLVANGPNEWPGARFIVRDDGTRYDLRHTRGSAEQSLEYGYKVERHMRDDDLVLFNRQPSLHKMSIMGHRVKVLPYSTFRLNLSVTPPYNADFDGDEMNMHLAQTHETRSEIKHLMQVPRQIVSPQGNKPVMGIIQDSLLGISKFTRRDTFLDKAMLMNLLMWLPDWDGNIPTPAILKPECLWTAKQVISLLLQDERINLQRPGNRAGEKENPNFSASDGHVIIRKGEHLAGVIDKRTTGSSSGSLVHILFHECGPEKTNYYLTYAQKVVNYWLLNYGFSVGVADIIPADTTVSSVGEALNKSKEEVKKLVGEAQTGKLKTQPGKTMFESFESQVNQELNKARDTSGKIASESLDEKNNIIAMVSAGSKGSSINISQIMACVGQQNVEGKRIPFGFANRTLPHFTKDDYGPESRGFVENSYLSGLTPQEFFFHAMGGREGIIDTACKTSETGYIQRRLIKAMEDVQVQYDRTVRNSLGNVIQFLYGEDGMAGEFIEDQVLDFMKMNNDKLEETYRHDYELPPDDRGMERPNDNYGTGWLSDRVRQQLIAKKDDSDPPLNDLEGINSLEKELKDIKEAKHRLCTEYFKDGEAKQHLPINIERIIENARNQFPRRGSLNDPHNERFSPVTICRAVDKLLEELKVVQGDDEITQEIQQNARGLLTCHLRAALGSRKLMEKDQLTEQAFECVLGAVREQFFKSLAHPGEVVGALAAQSIGEPATQMTLNTFHFAGVSAKNVTLGVPRLRELINVAKTVKTPGLTVFLKPEYVHDRDKVREVSTNLEMCNLDKLISYWTIIYDPDIKSSITEDREWVEEYFDWADAERGEEVVSPWVLRVVLDSKVFNDKRLEMQQIGERVTEEFGYNFVSVIQTDDNAEELVMRIRLKPSPEGEEAENEEEVTLRQIAEALPMVRIKGIVDIKKVYMREENKVTYLENGSFMRTKEWVMDTDGVNLPAVLAADDVDHTRTISNSIVEVAETLGIEAVRASLLNEVRRVISFDGSYVNYRHLAVLCDIMTARGTLTSITRHGINRIDRGPMMKCSFEETVEILVDAAMFAETDEMKGITENIMLGQLCRFGTGAFDIMIDEDGVAACTGTAEGQDLLAADAADFLHDNYLGAPAAALHSLQSMSGLFSPAQPQSPDLPHTLTSPMQAAFMNELPQTKKGQYSDVNALFSPEPGGGERFMDQGPMSPAFQAPMSPQYRPGAGAGPLSPIYQAPFSPAPLSPAYRPAGAAAAAGRAGPMSRRPFSPSYSPTSPSYGAPMSPRPMGAQATTPGYGMRAMTPGYQVGGRMLSPGYSPTSPSGVPGYNPASPAYNRMGGYRPTSPAYAPLSPGGYRPTSPGHAPLSPGYRPPLSPGYIQSGRRGGAGAAGPVSPGYSPSSPAYTPQSPNYGPQPRAAAYSPTSPKYSPSSPAYSPRQSEPQDASPKAAVSSPSQSYELASPSEEPPSAQQPRSGGQIRPDAGSPESPAYSEEGGPHSPHHGGPQSPGAMPFGASPPDPAHPDPAERPVPEDETEE